MMSSSSRLPNPQYNGYPTSASTSDLRRTATVNARQPNNQLPPLNLPQSASDTHNAQKRERKPDWGDFYRNGIPKEVIVIDDDTPEPPQLPQSSTQASGTITTSGIPRHTDKKRKTAASTAYDPVYQHHQSYSATQTPYYDHPSSHNTASTDRTASAMNTTTATSLVSQASSGAYLPPLDDGVVGQKRKRTRQAAQDEANEAKRRELERAGDPYSAYVPPPNPPIKAKDVYVQVIPDVRVSRALYLSLVLIRQKPHTKDQKVDDDDGHYIVHQDADLTERCKRRTELVHDLFLVAVT